MIFSKFRVGCSVAAVCVAALGVWIVTSMGPAPYEPCALAVDLRQTNDGKFATAIEAAVQKQLGWAPKDFCFLGRTEAAEENDNYGANGEILFDVARTGKFEHSYGCCGFHVVYVDPNTSSVTKILEYR